MERRIYAIPGEPPQPLMARLGPHGNARPPSVVPPAPDIADTPDETLKLTQAVQKLNFGNRDEILSHEFGRRLVASS